MKKFIFALDVSQWLVHLFRSSNGMSKPAMLEDFLSPNA